MVEVGIQRDHYSVSEQPLLNSVTVCVEINNRTLEREIVVNLNTVDITTQGENYQYYSFVPRFPFPTLFKWLVFNIESLTKYQIDISFSQKLVLQFCYDNNYYIDKIFYRESLRIKL